MTPELIIVGILTSGIRLATPYLYSAIGEVPLCLFMLPLQLATWV
jgi:hypothetical protein